ncbi:MAG: hypothetical protein E6Q37_05680 [Crocinitomicaceae bacterium]|nr:MAG: hypothetical protein E6Q37_05680 [Crocinitomicaceae bacterium]
MKKLVFSCFAIVYLSFNGFATEMRLAQEIVAQTEIQRPRYVLKTGALKVAVFNMPFGESYLISEKDKLFLKTADVRMIELVFSDFPKGEDLKKLNLNRIKEVESWRKTLVSNPEITWKIIRQTDCTNEAEAKTLFHGVVIHYKGPQTEEDRILEFTTTMRFLPLEEEIKDPVKLRKSLPDSTIFKVLERNKQWKKMAVVADLTGSMSPYTAQLVLWFKLKTKDQRIQDLIFFNDGDKTPDAKKVIGKTGGIYHGKGNNYKQVRELALKTIQGGCGGDAPENNCEALLFALENAPDAEEYILIADNFAPIKDAILMNQIHKPIRIILCGTSYGINLQYLNLARKTGGSVHTMESDLVDLIKMNEGEKFTFMKQKFIIKNGVIVKG